MFDAVLWPGTAGDLDLLSACEGVGHKVDDELDGLMGVGSGQAHGVGDRPGQVGLGRDVRLRLLWAGDSLPEGWSEVEGVWISTCETCLHRKVAATAVGTGTSTFFMADTGYKRGRTASRALSC